MRDEFVFNHEIYAEKFYTFTVKVPRLSGASDNVRVMVSERLIMDGEYCIGDMIEVTGQSSVPITVTENGDNRSFLRCRQKTSATLTKKKAKTQTHFS